MSSQNEQKQTPKSKPFSLNSHRETVTCALFYCLCPIPTIFRQNKERGKCTDPWAPLELQKTTTLMLDHHLQNLPASESPSRMKSCRFTIPSPTWPRKRDHVSDLQKMLFMSSLLCSSFVPLFSGLSPIQVLAGSDFPNWIFNRSFLNYGLLFRL